MPFPFLFSGFCSQAAVLSIHGQSAFAPRSMCTSGRRSENRAVAPSARFERATSRSGTACAIPCTTRAWSVREESNLHAEATGLRPAERTACSTHGRGALPESKPTLRAPRARAFPRRQKAPVDQAVDQAGFEPAASGVWDRRSGLAELLIGTPGRSRTCTLLIRNQRPYPLGYRGSVPGGGVEPPAFRLSGGCSPAELTGAWR